MCVAAVLGDIEMTAEGVYLDEIGLSLGVKLAYANHIDVSHLGLFAHEVGSYYYDGQLVLPQTACAV